MVKNRAEMAPDLDDKEQFCPLCMEELDLTDKSFHPCRCGYQVCLWCFHNIQDKLNGLCPACRTPYDKASLNKLDPNLLAAAEADRKRKKEQQRVEKATAKAAAAAAAAAEQKDHRSDRSSLQNVRVMQRNLVYVTGLPPPIAKEDILRKKEHFGRFGRIVKVAVNKKTSTSTHSAYVTFKRNADASDCISHINSLVQEGRTSMRATFGTTKYCSFFLRHIQCNNPGCLYLHELANESECFTKEDLQHEFQMDEFDMDYHGSQNNHSADVPSLSVSTSTAVSQQKSDHSPIRRESAKPAVSAPGESHSRTAQNLKVSAPASAVSDANPPPRVSILRNPSPAVPVAAEPQIQASASTVPCDGSGNIPPRPLSAEQTFPGYPSDSRLRIPRPPTQSRRSFVPKDDDSTAQIVLPGISALGLGKADSGPFGWDLQRHTEPRGSQKAAISPPDSPRTQQRVEQQKMFRSLLPNVDVSFIPQPNRSAEFNLFSPPAVGGNLRPSSMFGPPFSNHPLGLEKAPISSAVGPPPGSDHRPSMSWSHTMPPGPVYPAGFDSYSVRDRAPRPPPPGLSASGSHQMSSLPPRFDRQSPPPGMAPLYDQPGPSMISPRFNPPSHTPAGFVQQGSAPEDYRMSSQTPRYPPNTPSNAPGLIQRPSMEPVLHINGAWFGM